MLMRRFSISVATVSDPRYPNPDDMEYSVVFNYEFIEDTRDDYQGYSNY